MDFYAGGQLLFSVGLAETVVNDDGLEGNFRIESSNITNIFFVNSITDKIGIGTSTPQQELNIIGSGNITGDLILKQTNVSDWLYNQSSPYDTFNYNMTVDGNYDYNMSTPYDDYNYNMTDYGDYNYNETQDSDGDWILRDANMDFNFNESQLETEYFLADSINVVTGIGAGTLADIQTYNRTTYNVTEANSDYELIVNFTGITDFTTLIVRHKTDVDAGHLASIEIWDYKDSAWEGYGHLIETLTSDIKTLGVYDADDHIEDGVVQVRFYQLEVGNAGHVHQFDWVVISARRKRRCSTA